MKKTFIILFSFILFLLACGNNTKSKESHFLTPNSNSNQEIIPQTKPTVNVFVENSGSMDGYVKGVTEFEEIIYDYLSNIELKISDTINLNYINNKIIFKGSDIQKFIKNIEPSDFKSSGGDIGSSDIAKVLKSVLAETQENEVAILVTDGIFSPGRGVNAADYLGIQRTDIKNTMASYLKNYPNTVVVVYQLSSQFDGICYNRENAKTKIKTKRPFYIWLIGDFRQVSLLKSSVLEDKFKGNGVEHIYTLLPSAQSEIQYSILNSPKHGSFDRDRKAAKTSIYNIKNETKGKYEGQFLFSIGMDLSLFSVLLGDDYLMDENNYARLVNKKTTTDLNVEIKHNENPEQKYTHNMLLSCNKIPVGDLEIVLVNRLPQWVYDMNDDEGLNINANDAINKTFGIKYLVEGIFEAYDMQGDNIYTKMNFKLNK
jgi:hypothetical protein